MVKVTKDHRYKVVSLFGIRSDIIKLSPVFPLLDKTFHHIMVHSNQHYDENMDKIFFNELHLRKPDYNLGSGSGTQAQQTSRIMLKFEEILMKEKPDAVIVQGDTNTAIAGSITASKLNIPLVHIEGGCRGFAKNEPEEINRKVSDHLSDLIFAPDRESVRNLYKEGFEKDRVILRGNTSLDVCLRNLRFTNDKILGKYDLKKKRFVLVTIHRSQNTSVKERIENIMRALEQISSFCDVVFPIHPRTRKALENFKIKIGGKIKLLEPIGYTDFLSLMKNAKIIITDSAGIQEEAVFVNVPCIIAYGETPWTPYVKSGKNKLIGYKKESIVSEAKKLINNQKYYDSIKRIPYKHYDDVSLKIVSEIGKWLDK